MTRITIITAGSRGDVQPYIALGRGLLRAGHAVTVLATANFESLVTEAGLGFRSMGRSIEERVNTDEWRAVLESGNFIKVLGKMQSEMKVASQEQAKLLPPLIEGSELLIMGMAGIGLSSLPEKYRIPVVHAHLFPFSPTRAFPAPLVTRLPFGAVLNPLSFHITRQLFWQSNKASDVALRRAMGMSGGAPFWGPFRHIAQSGAPTLHGYSAHVLPRPSDWDATHHVTGYWFLDEPNGWQPPADLAAFLDAGAPPVYIGFGSMGSRTPEQLANIAIEALARTGQRGILSSGWGGLKAENLPDTVHQIGSVPHSWLFPRMAAVVHHGGAGTSGAGARAGVPTQVIPFMADQPFWGHRLASLGVAPAPIPRKRLTSDKLAASIRQMTSDTAMRQRAHALGERIRAEDGIGQAVALIERALVGRHAHA